MTSRQPARTRRPTLPCLTIARSPANDVRVIVNAFASTPALAGLLTDRAGFVGEHRAELRELLQQLTARIGAWIESAERSTADDHRARRRPTVSGVGSGEGSGGGHAGHHERTSRRDTRAPRRAPSPRGASRGIHSRRLPRRVARGGAAALGRAMQVRPSLHTVRDDAFNPPVAGSADAARYSEWHHFNFNDEASEVYGLFNLALSGDVSQPPRARAGVSLVVCERGVGWHGTMNVPARGAPSCRVGRRRDRWQQRLRRGATSWPGRWDGSSPSTRPTRRKRVPCASITSGRGRLFLSPSFDVEGTLILDGREIPLRGATGYHDHNWGTWDWGRDIGWDWGYLIEPPGSGRTKTRHPPLSIVFGQVTDATRVAARSDLVVLVWEGERWSRAFVGDAVSITTTGERRYGDVPRIPGVLALLAPDRPRIPERVDIRAADGDDVLEITLHVDAAMQFLIPHPATAGRTTIAELVGHYSERGRLDGRAVAFEYVGFAELAG
jgi:hypothetical protein